MIIWTYYSRIMRALSYLFVFISNFTFPWGSLPVKYLISSKICLPSSEIKSSGNFCIELYRTLKFNHLFMKLMHLVIFYLVIGEYPNIVEEDDLLEPCLEPACEYWCVVFYSFPSKESSSESIFYFSIIGWFYVYSYRNYP